MKGWLVWEVVNDYPESGGGEYLSKVFQNEVDAKAYCDKMNKEQQSEAVWYGAEESNTFYSIDSWEVE